MSLFTNLQYIAQRDVEYVTKRNQEYGESWCRRGGHQAFAVIWRKADRIESIMAKMANGFDIFEAWEKNPGDIRDDLRDLRQYLLLLEEYMEREHLDSLQKQVTKTMPKGISASFDVDSGVPQSRGYVNQD